MKEQEILEKTNPPANLGDFVTEGTGACRYNEAIKQIPNLRRRSHELQRID
jgi:hypothetical protein